MCNWLLTSHLWKTACLQTGFSQLLYLFFNQTLLEVYGFVTGSMIEPDVPVHELSIYIYSFKVLVFLYCKVPSRCPSRALNFGPKSCIGVK